MLSKITNALNQELPPFNSLDEGVDFLMSYIYRFRENLHDYAYYTEIRLLEIRDEISQKEIGLSNEEMKHFRDMIIKSNKDHHKLITMSPDFYSLSTLRDLLFHVQESTFTLAEIKDCLSRLDLKFCGFDQGLQTKMQRTNACKDDFYSLDFWHRFEESHPWFFGGMFEFWCQKPL